MTKRQKETIRTLKEEIAKLSGFKSASETKKETKKEKNKRIMGEFKKLKKEGILNYEKEVKNE